VGGPGSSDLGAAVVLEAMIDRMEVLSRRIESCGRDPKDVQVVAVTKGMPAATIVTALRAGLSEIGENYASELLAKASDLSGASAWTKEGGSDADEDDLEASEDDLRVAHGDKPEDQRWTTVPRWHYLGAIQRRRVKLLAPLVSCWQSVSRAVEGKEIAAHARGAGVFVQINVDGAPGRNGCRPDEARGLVDSLRADGLNVRGLMVVAPQGPPAVADSAFGAVQDLAGQLALAELSMGMSEDLEIALRRGSTMLRLGRSLFGPRPSEVR